MRTITAHGKTLTTEEWADRIGITVEAIYHRMANCATPEDIVRPKRAKASVQTKRKKTTRTKQRLEDREAALKAAIFASEAIKNPEGFTLDELARELGREESALKAAFYALQRREVFIEIKHKVSGNWILRYRPRTSAGDLLRRKWRKTGNSWLGLEPRLGVQW